MVPGTFRPPAPTFLGQIDHADSTVPNSSA